MAGSSRSGGGVATTNGLLEIHQRRLGYLLSYGDEGFIYWKRARVAQVLFDIKNGWLLFSPLMGISLLGIFMGFGTIATTNAGSA